MPTFDSARLKGLPGLATLAWITCLTGTVRAEPTTVLSVHAPSMDWPEARRDVEAELRASGFDVVPRQSAAVDPTGLLTELASRSAEHPDSVGAVTVLRVGSTGLAYVWIPARQRMFRVNVPTSDARVAAGMLSLRVADLMAVRPWAEPEPPPKPPPADTAPPAPESPRLKSWIWLGLGPTFGSVTDQPGGHVTLGVNVSFAEHWSLDFGGAASLLTSNARLPEGAVSVDHQQLGAHLLVHPVRAQRWSLAGGLGGGALCLQVQGTTDENVVGLQDAACAGLVTLRARVLVHWDQLLLWATLEPGLALPPVHLRADDRAAGTIGRPWLSASVGVGWRL